MLRTIREIYILIKKKRDNAFNDLRATIDGREMNLDKEFHLQGELDAYTDVLILLETSGVVEDELVR